MITAKKLKRELARPFEQLARNFWLPARRAGGTLRRIRYDATRKINVRVTDGVLDAWNEIAVLLIYQPNGVAESIYFTLSYLIDQGISPIVVSNLPLSDPDRKKLSEKSWKVIERPNVGYDFGGYREGILTVLEHGLRPDALYVLNDSIWFPLKASSDTIARCRAASEDIFGLKINILKKRSGNREIVHSYFYRFSARIVASGQFSSYWRQMRLINHKLTVIDEFEMKLSPYFSRHGFSVGSIADPQKVNRYLVSLDDQDKLSSIFDFQCRAFPSQAKSIRAAFCKSHDGVYRDHLAKIIDRHGFFTATYTLHPWVSEALNCDFLKKSDSVAINAKRDEVRRLRLHEEFHPTVKVEIERWDTPGGRGQ